MKMSVCLTQGLVFIEGKLGCLRRVVKLCMFANDQKLSATCLPTKSEISFCLSHFRAMSQPTAVQFSWTPCQP